MEIRKPTVAHVMRVYLSKTETFIGDQIFTLRRFRPVVLCRDRLDGHSYSFNDVFSAVNMLNPLSRAVENCCYRFFRCPTKAAIKSLVSKVKEESVRLLHYHYLVDARFFLDLKRKSGLPALVMAHGYDVSSFPRRYLRYGKKWLQPIFDEMELFVAISEDMKRDLTKIGCPEEKIVIHYHGIDAKRFAYPERQYRAEEEINILTCGTLGKKKAQHLIFAALRYLERQGKITQKFRLTIVGDGPMKSRLVQMVREYGWQDKVTFTGHIPHHDARLMEEYRKAHIFILPSITTSAGEKEGIPRTIAEAMAAGLPVVSTYHAGIPEIIQSGKQGILVKEGDVIGLGQALWMLMEDHELRERLGRAAAAKAIIDLDLSVRIRNLERIYQQAMG